MRLRVRPCLLFLIGDAAVALLKAGAEIDKKDVDGNLALDLAPDKEVRAFKAVHWQKSRLADLFCAVKQVRKYIERMAEGEGIEL